MSDTLMFQGYLRSDGRVGVRNLVVVIPSVGCSHHAARVIADRVEGAILLDYQEGCGETEVDTEVAIQLLSQCATHPNVVGSIVVSLGCETLNAHDLTDRIVRAGGRPELLVIQEQGGTRSTIEKGIALAREMVEDARDLRREPCPLSALTIGLECGGSDATSGMAANPALGAFSDLMVAQGAKVILAETSELLGAEHVLRERAATPEIAERLLRTIDACEAFLKSTGEDFVGKQPSPGNIVGGITTVEEKALGDVLKGGTLPIVDVLRYGAIPSLPGLSFMDTPGNDATSVTGLAAGHSQIVVFTTGRGNPMGNPIVPVVKLTGNSHTFRRMVGDIDLDAGTILRGEETVQEVGQRIFDLCVQVAAGEVTAAEAMGHAEFAILRQGPIY